jgi:hypothetical protein
LGWNIEIYTYKKNKKIKKNEIMKTKTDKQTIRPVSLGRTVYADVNDLP